jgi:Lar family restriction alleviation protein
METHKEDGSAAGELLPCPFCGGVPRLWNEIGHDHEGFSRVFCRDFYDCAAMGPASMNREEAIKGWNRRSAPAKPPNSSPIEPPQGSQE